MGPATATATATAAIPAAGRGRALPAKSRISLSLSLSLSLKANANRLSPRAFNMDGVLSAHWTLLDALLSPRRMEVSSEKVRNGLNLRRGRRYLKRTTCILIVEIVIS